MMRIRVPLAAALCAALLTASCSGCRTSPPPAEMPEATYRETVTAFYTSNVEYYLMRERTFDRFARTAAALPRDERSVLVRSCFGYACGPGHPHAAPGYYSVQLLQSLDDFAALAKAGELRGYHDLVSQRLLPPG